MAGDDEGASGANAEDPDRREARGESGTDPASDPADAVAEGCLAYTRGTSAYREVG